MCSITTKAAAEKNDNYKTKTKCDKEEDKTNTKIRFSSNIGR